MITLGIIGIVAAMTIPTLVADYQKRTYDTAATTFERKLGEALKVMNSQQTLAGFNSTEDFVEELSKHFKITKTCANDKLTECFGEEVFWGSGTATPEAVDMSKIKKAKNFGQKEWQETNVVGVQFANGVTALIAYNKDAKQDPYSNQIVNISGGSDGKSGSVSLGTDALAILYDTNGLKSPNQSSKDLRSINVSQLGSGCFAEINGICITMQPARVTPMSYEECAGENAVSPRATTTAGTYAQSLGIKQCFLADDYWAGAVKHCGGVDKMVTRSQLAEIANYIYNTNGITAEQTGLYYATMNTDRFAELGLSGDYLAVWAEEETSFYGYRRDFRTIYTQGGHFDRNNNNHMALCVE